MPHVFVRKPGAPTPIAAALRRRDRPRRSRPARCCPRSPSSSRRTIAWIRSRTFCRRCSRRICDASRYELLVCDSNSTDGTAEYLARVRADHPNVRHLPARSAGEPPRATRASRPREARSCCSTTPTSWHRRICSRRTCARHRERARHRRRRPRSASQRPRGVRAQARSSRGSRASASAVAKKTLVAVFSDGQRLGATRRICCSRLLRRELHRVRARGSRAGVSSAPPGIEICYEPRAVNYHCQDVAARRQKEKMRLAGRSTARFYRKHPDVRGEAQSRDDAAIAGLAFAACAAAHRCLGYSTRAPNGRSSRANSCSSTTTSPA